MLWENGFTCVSTWLRWMNVAFAIDAYARRILGCRTATSMTSELALDAIEYAVRTCQRDGLEDLAILIHLNHRGFTSITAAYRSRQH
ncbi:hypothetical protein [Mycolicibacterium lutetiense]